MCLKIKSTSKEQHTQSTCTQIKMVYLDEPKGFLVNLPSLELILRAVILLNLLLSIEYNFCNFFNLFYYITQFIHKVHF